MGSSEHLTRHINVKDFGAIGNGIADDSPAFNSAIAEMQKGDILYIPPGRYKLEDSIEPITKIITIEGTKGYSILDFSKAPKGRGGLINATNIDGRPQV